MLLQVSLALVITYQMLTFADFDAVALITPYNPNKISKFAVGLAQAILRHFGK